MSQQLIAAWGPPQQVISDAQGGQIFIYVVTAQWTTPGRSTTYSQATAVGYWNTAVASGHSQTTYTPPKTHTFQTRKMFYVNSNGYIYNWAWKHL